MAPAWFTHAKEAMRFLNIFATNSSVIFFPFILDTRIKDTLCGTKCFGEEITGESSVSGTPGAFKIAGEIMSSYSVRLDVICRFVDMPCITQREPMAKRKCPSRRFMHKIKL